MLNVKIFYLCFSDKLTPCYPPSYDEVMNSKESDVTIQGDGKWKRNQDASFILN